MVARYSVNSCQSDFSVFLVCFFIVVSFKKLFAAHSELEVPKNKEELEYRRKCSN